MTSMIPFNKPYMSEAELAYIAEAHANGHLSGDGPFTKRCNAWLQAQTGTPKAMLTHSCTAALEMAVMLADVGPGDEVIMPSFTFVSTANAVAVRGAIPVFVDVRPDTLNLDETQIEAAITPRTKAILPVHYAGVGCEMDTIMAIADRHNVLIIEDAAQGILSDYHGKALGTIGHFGCLSFHETKNLHSGEGGALLVNDERYIQRAEIIREKGTNRSAFFRGEVDKYTWVDIGSSFLPSELIAAFLWAQMEQATSIMDRRRAIWQTYHDAFADLEAAGLIQRPSVPDGLTHNAHIYYLLLPDLDARTAFIAGLKAQGVHSVFHYVPLHSAPAGRQYGRAHGGDLPVTTRISDQLVRLPLWIGVEEHQEDIIDKVIAQVKQVCG
jgi:dTDP-4-amino-4,6-dideoxygalactose transaminase